jgi:glycosyltransferase involved in cell wall biosynthesis
VHKKIIIISGINLFEGGPLSIIKDVLEYLNNSKFHQDFHFIALVHKKSLFTDHCFRNIEFLEFPKSRKSYLRRLYYEYVSFKSLSKKIKPYFWLSLHDITPNVECTKQAVYCHNPSPFNGLNFKDIYLQPTLSFFSLFYKYLYKINIKRNKYVIVQQMWIKERFIDMFKLQADKIIVAIPKLPSVESKYLIKEDFESQDENNEQKVLFFPTFPRPFKNIEVIAEALKLIPEQLLNKISVVVTLDGSENTYAKAIVEKYKHNKSIKFIGLLSREEVFNYYSKSDVLLFPSKLETWGLPISEFKQFNKPIFVSDLPYARETVGKYHKVKFFDSSNPKELATLLTTYIKNQITYDHTTKIEYPAPKANNWERLFEILLN